MKKENLAIVQPHPTQFDTSLFKALDKKNKFNFCVYFTHSSRNELENSFDPEIDRQSGWDMDTKSGYSSLYFSNNFFKKIFESYFLVKNSDLIIISGYNYVLYLIILLLSKFSNTKIGLRADSVFLYREENIKWKLKDFLLPKFFKIYDYGFPTGSLAKEFMIKYGFDKEKLFYFPYAIDQNFLENSYKKFINSRDELRKSFNIKKDDFVILGVLKFVDREDPMTLIKAFRELYIKNNKYQLVLVGDGILKYDLLRFMDSNKLKNVHLTGYINYSELAKFYVLSDVFVHSAVVEQWGVSVNEAMTCMTPVIAADTVGSSYDLIPDNNCGKVFKSRDSIDLSKKIKELFLNPVLREKIILNAKKKVNYWSYNLTISEIERCLKINFN